MRIFCVLLLLIPFATSAQKGVRMEKGRNAKEQIANLKTGALLVRLQTRENTIQRMIDFGERRKAEAVRAEQRNKNLEIVRAFTSDFDFCPVYFFYSNDSKWIVTQQFDSIAFLDTNLTPSSAIKMEHANFLTAEYGRIMTDTVAPTVMEYQMVPSEKGPKKIPIYYGSPNMGFNALIVKSDIFVQLRRPFPYYVRTLESLPFRRRTQKTVRLLNKQLNEFYSY